MSETCFECADPLDGDTICCLDCHVRMHDPCTNSCTDCRGLFCSSCVSQDGICDACAA